VNWFDRPTRVGEGRAQDQVDVAVYIAWVQERDNDPAAVLPVNKLDAALADDPYRPADIALGEQRSTCLQVHSLHPMTELNDVGLGQRRPFAAADASGHPGRLVCHVGGRMAH
jgi:hypothetical protein